VPSAAQFAAPSSGTTDSGVTTTRTVAVPSPRKTTAGQFRFLAHDRTAIFDIGKKCPHVPLEFRDVGGMNDPAP
jgi:hypothetical protein